METDEEFINGIMDDIVKDYVDYKLKAAFEKEGLELSEGSPTTKVGYTEWSFANGYGVINDGKSIKIKKDGKEIKQFNEPKANRSKAVSFLVNSMKNESKEINQRENTKDIFSRIKVVKGVKNLVKIFNQYTNFLKEKLLNR